jgi:endonuclease-3 related protein
VIGAYLTQNTSWRGVELSIENLRQVQALSIGGLLSISEDELRRLIRPSGYMVRKASALKAFVAMLDAEFGGSLDLLAATPTDITRARLLALPGVGDETADAILLYALGHPAFVVDEYFRRVVSRHRLIEGSRPRYAELQQLAHGAFAIDEADSRSQYYNEFHALIVAVGKRHCGPTPRCSRCPLAASLPSWRE